MGAGWEGWRSGVWPAACLAGFVAITVALAAGTGLEDLDLAVREWAEAHRPPPAEVVARLLNYLGQGGPLLAISVALAGWLAWRTRRLRPLFYVLVAAVLVTGVVLPIKHLTERGAPSADLAPERTVALMGPLPPDQYDAGYPSGHLVNTVVWYGVLLLLGTALLRAYGRSGPPSTVRWGIRIVPPVVVLVTSTYLSYHWLTDGLAGLALGLFLAWLPHRLGVIPAAAGEPRPT